MIREYYEAICNGVDVRANLIALRNALKDEKEIRAFAYLLGGDFSVLGSLLVHEDPKVRKNAAILLGKMESEDMLPLLFETYQKEETRFIRADYLKAMEHMDYAPYLGKLQELSGAIVPSYTMEGRLLGHISLFQAEVAKIAASLGIEDCEEVTLVRHMILSHHGVYEYGSPVLPMIPEAEVLHLIDNLDARMNTIEKALNATEEGAFTPPIFALENRSLYKSKIKK